MVRKGKAGAEGLRSQAGFHKSWWPYSMRHYTFARRAKIVDGDSIYNKRHKIVHCKAKQIPHGTFVDYLPTPSAKRQVEEKELGHRTRKGLLVGFHVQPGGLWSGDYLVVDWDTLQHHPNATPGQCRIHRVPEVFYDWANLDFPLADYRKI